MEKKSRFISPEDAGKYKDFLKGTEPESGWGQ